ncbi:MAG: ATP-binding protein, partial [Campylobacterota bacterium]|nr:ATP-binding protein [Campylobacterota bacterium]
NKYPNLNIVEVDNINDGLEQVEKGKLFGYIGSLASVGYMFQTKYIGELKIAGKFDEKWELGIAVRSDDKVLFDILNKVVKSIDASKRQKILNNWIAIKYEKNFDKDLMINIFIVVFIIIIFFIYKQYILKKSINEFNEVINATMEGILIFKDGICIDANQSTLDIFGYSTKKELIGKSPLEFISNESKEYVKEQFKEVEALPYEAKLIKKDGTKFYGLLRGQNLENKNVRLSSVIDISKLKQQETALIEQSRMVAMGEMIGNIAHQWRQPLSVISTGATGLQIQKEHNILTDEQFYETCNAINNNAQYLSKTIDDFKNFIKGNRKKQRFNLKENIDSFIKLVEGSIKTNHINLIATINNKIFLDGYPNELIQCYINIFNNSKDVLIDAEDNKLIFINTIENKDSIIITIKDNGGGIPKDIILKIFDPYFTTKHKSQGTGLGLHTTYNLIKDGMDGTIEVKNVNYEYENIKYSGAEFIITLPKIDNK